MDVSVHFRHVTRSHETEEQVRRWLRMQLLSWLPKRDLKVHLYVSKVAPRTEAHGALIDCHVVARAPWLGKEVFAKSSSLDFWDALIGCTRALRTQIKKDRERMDARA